MMDLTRTTKLCTAFLLMTTVSGAQTRPGQASSSTPTDSARRGFRAPTSIQTMTLTSTAWPDGGLIPVKYTQAGPEMSPGLQWSGAPQGAVSYVLTMIDADTVVNNSTDGLLHWMLWNIPGSASSIAQGKPDGFELEDGVRQISVSGSRYRGPGAQAAGPLHHYVFELYALDVTLDVKVNAQGPQEANPSVQAIRAAVFAGMVGHVRGKAAYVGLFHRSQ